jgi:hypothetical protein
MNAGCSFPSGKRETKMAVFAASKIQFKTINASYVGCIAYLRTSNIRNSIVPYALPKYTKEGVGYC